MNYNDFAYNTKIQKISSAVIRGMNSGKDPFAEILKEAQTENLTPNLVKAAVQHINNEIFLNHYTRGGEEKIQIIDPEKVIDALNINEPVESRDLFGKVASSDDYWDLRKKRVLTKIAGEPYENISNRNRTNSIRAISEMKKKASDKKLEFDIYSKIVKTASEIQEDKKKLYNEALLAIRRQEVPVEEIDFVKKTASDGDIEEILELSIQRGGIKPKYDLMKNGNLFDDYNVNKESPILQQVKNILVKKANLNKLINQYKGLKNE